VNFFSFHIGDYATHTAHLEPMEDLAYRRMLDLYYRTEKPLPEIDSLMRLIRMKDHHAEVSNVLAEFFEWDGEGCTHARCDAEIAKMQDKQSKAKASAQASVNARSTNAQRTLNERPAVVELPIPIPIPIPKEEKKEKSAPLRVAPSVLVEAGFSPEAAAEFIAHKSRHKAPLTERAWADHLAESLKAGWAPLQAAEKVMAKGWKGFEAKYVASETPAAPRLVSFRERDAELAKEQGRRWMGTAAPLNFIDMETANARIEMG